MSEITHLRDLTPDPSNARRHNPRNVGMVVDALHEVGAARSIVIDENGVVLAGNATLEAAGQAGIERVQVVDADGDTIIAVRRTGLSSKQKKRLALFDNRASELADWNVPVLLDEPDLLAGMFRDDEIDALMASLVEPKEAGGGGDEFDGAVQDGPTRTQVGDVWRVGQHRLMCGDSTKAEDVARLMGGERAELCFTSPPYNLGTTTGGGFPKRGGMWQTSGLENGYTGYADDMPQEEYFSWQSTLLLLVWRDVLTDNGAIFYNYRPRVQAGQLVTPFLWNPDLPVRQVVIWNSGAGINFAPTHYRPACEWVVIFAKEAFRLDSKSASGCGDVWDIPAQQRDGGHPAPYPVALPLRALETTGAPSVYDPYLGSGTTMIAAERTGRKCYGMEIEPKYCDVILRRAEAEGIAPIERVS